MQGIWVRSSDNKRLVLAHNFYIITEASAYRDIGAQGYILVANYREMPDDVMAAYDPLAFFNTEEEALCALSEIESRINYPEITKVIQL